jgi:hypothetical protein
MQYQNHFMQVRDLREMIVCDAQTELMKFNDGVIIRRARARMLFMEEKSRQKPAANKRRSITEIVPLKSGREELDRIQPIVSRP